MGRTRSDQTIINLRRMKMLNVTVKTVITNKAVANNATQHGLTVNEKGGW